MRARTPTLILALTLTTLATGTIPGVANASNTCGEQTTKTITPQDNLQDNLHSLCPGDTLQLASGTYKTGYVRLYAGALGRGGIQKGSSQNPITVKGEDPANPPLLQGGLQLTGADNWHLENLRLQATEPNMSALYMNNGTGWVIRNCEMFGARTTNSMANVVIAGNGGYPKNFLLTGNRIHDAARSTRKDTTDHNLYINFQGTAGTGGLVTHNVIWGAPHGAGIKLGNGGNYNALGPWGVQITQNTLYNNGRQILLHGNIRNNTITGNLLTLATQHFNKDPRTTQIYIHDVTGTRNTISRNYAFGATMFSYDPKHRATYGKGNALSNAPSFNPGLKSQGGRSLVPTNPKATAFGAYS